MKESIIDIIIKSRNGHYCHCVEVENVYQLEMIAETIFSDFIDTHTKEDILEFLETLEVYSLDDDNEEDIYDFSFTEYVNDFT